jgi:hypothetical protein
MADYTEEREALTATRLKLEAVFAAPGSREPMYRTLCAVLSELSDQLETYEDWSSGLEPGDVMVLSLLTKVQALIAKELE